MFIRLIYNLCNSFPRRSSLLCTTFKSVLSSAQFATTGIKSEESALQISQSCIDRLKKIAPAGSFLRITIDGGGCSGFQYRFSFDTKSNSDDIFVEKDGAKIVVDSLSLDFIKGSTIDFHEELIRSSFRITNNPKIDTNCSCGTSFSIKTA